MSAKTLVILAALRDELSPLTKLLQLTEYEGMWIGEAGPWRVVARVGGVGPARAGRALTELIGVHRPGLAISVGFAGGLDPQLGGGDVVEPAWSIDGRGAAYRLGAAAPPQLGSDDPARAASEAIITVAGPLHLPDAKRREFERSRAAVADMETFALAAIASRAGVPLLSVRAVSDPADVALPPQALSWVSPDGTSDARAASRFALTHPAWVPVLLKLGRFTRRGSEALARRVHERITADHG